jgi:hypothetical protein
MSALNNISFPLLDILDRPYLQFAGTNSRGRISQILSGGKKDSFVSSVLFPIPLKYAFFFLHISAYVEDANESFLFFFAKSLSPEVYFA